ncbi:site-specific DNA-methyltransferase [Mediterranea massiliensis]|uniref:site-specific DNA-methyltransferase n=1 Tax=Mediterranea massiliensis TaxID=1841865 RepID=UPI00266C868A|nr:site-specific DNA-methyltransferase [Mediterranea massiliensis]
MMEKLKMQSLDVVGSNIKKIQQLFPNCVTERLGKDGKPELAIDFEKLQAELSNEIIGEGEERYQFTWPGKRAANRLANTPTTMTLRPCREESVDFDHTQNLYIEGDNLDVLKVLRETYLGKVKMIYIDPPYNTGNDFVYNDDFAQSRSEFEETSGLFDEEGNQTIDPMQRNTESNGRFHTDWLNMIYPRLKVARDLLSDDGVIFISIDDNEQKNLKNVCDEIFGPSSFIAQLIWERAFSPKNDAKFISNSHDYILMYSKNIEAFSIGRLPRTEEANARYSNPDNDPRGVWMSSDISVKTYNAACDYPITTPSGKIVEPPAGRCWSLSKNAFFERLQDNRIWFGPNGDNTPRLKRFLSELKYEGMAPTSLLFYKEVGHSQEGAQEVVSLFGDKGVFDGPKPVRLLQRLITLANLHDDSIVLDFFSGSATTAHALMKVNAEKQTNCKFILVQLPEKVSETKKGQGYKNICEIGKERIRRAGKKIKEENRDKEGIEKLDTGFRVLKLDSSNMNDVYYTPEDFDKHTLFSENVKSDRTPEDLLFQVMLDLGIELSAKIESRQIAGKTVYLVDDYYLVACFDRDVTEATITEIAKLHPVYFVMRDASAANDSVIDNFEQLFEAYSKDTVRKIL